MSSCAAPVLRVCGNGVTTQVQTRKARVQALARHHFVWDQQAVAPDIHVHQLPGALHVEGKC